MADTQLIISQATGLHPDSAREDVIQAIEAVEFLKQAAREARAVLEAQVIDWIDANGEIEHGNFRWYVGKKKRTKPNDLEAVADAVLSATGGDLKSFCEFLSANAFKPGACKSGLGMEAFAELFTVEEVPDLKTGKPKREVKKSDERFARA